MKRFFFSSRLSETTTSIGIFLLRAAGGAMMIPHGYGKIKKFDEMASMTEDILHIGKSPTLCLIIFAEFFCAILVVLGFFTRLASFVLVINMSVALFYAHQ